MNKQELIGKYNAERAKLRPYCSNRNTREEQLKDSIYTSIIDDLNQLDEPQKPAVPKFVAEWIEYAKKKGDSLKDSFKPWNLYGFEYSKADRWIDDNQETFAQAWLSGYEVKKEPMYYVILSENKGGWKYTFLDEEGSTDYTNNKAHIPTFTEKEIKGNDERFWPFAVPVEEVSEKHEI